MTGYFDVMTGYLALYMDVFRLSSHCVYFHARIIPTYSSMIVL
jgi:hypothetical protein